MAVKLIISLAHIIMKNLQSRLSIFVQNFNKVRVMAREYRTELPRSALFMVISPFFVRLYMSKGQHELGC